MNYPLQRQRESEPEFETPDAAPTSASLFVRIHSLLRGRYRWAVPLGILLGAAGAFLGYRSTEPQWTSTAAIRIRSVLPVVVAPTPENQQQVTDALKSTQIALLKSQRVIELAMQSEEWKALGRGFSDSDITQFSKALVINSDGRSEIIAISFSDAVSNAALAGVRSLVKAYETICVEGDIQNEKSRGEILENRRLTLNNEIRTRRENIKAIATGQFGTDDLRTMHGAKLANIQMLERQLMETNIELAALPRATTRPAVRKQPKEMSIDDI